MITEFKGQNGKLIIHDDYLEISRETFGGFISQGGSSGKTWRVKIIWHSFEGGVP